MAFSPRITADEFSDFNDEFEDYEAPIALKTAPVKQQAPSFENEFTDFVDEFEDVVEVTPKQQSLFQSFEQGLKRSASGEIAQQVFQNPEVQDEIVQNPNFWETLAQSGGEITGDLPYFLAGGALGTALGGTLGAVAGPIGTATVGLAGGAFGAMALPSFIKEALKEYRNYQAKGNDITFGEFLERADRVASKTLKEGAFGVILGSINKAMPMLQKLPGIGSLFTSKPAQKAAGITAETAALATLPAATEGRLPEAQDYAHALAIVLGLNLARLPAEVRDRIQKEGEASGLSPEEFAKSIPERELSEISNKVPAPEEAKVPTEEQIAEFKETGAKTTTPIEEKTEAVIEPLIEKTGEGAAERIEYAPTGIDKILSRLNSFIQAARTPGESLKRLGQATNEGIFNFIAPLERLETEIPVPEKVSTRIKLAQSAASEINSVLENGIFSNITGNFEHGGLKQAYGDLTWKKLSKGLKEGEHSLQDLDAYRTSKIALKRQAEGKKTGVDTTKAKEDVSRLAKQYEPIDKRIRDFQKATIRHYGKDLLGPELIEKWNSQYYSPLYRVMEEGKDSILSAGSLKPKQPFKKMVGSKRKIIAPSESDPYNAAMLIRNARKNDAILQYLNQVLKGNLPGKIKSAKLEPLPSNIALEELDIDPDIRKVAEALYSQTRKNAFTPEKNVLRGWKNGKPFTIEVPEEVYRVFSTFVPYEANPISKIFNATNRLFSRGISLEPRKFLSITGRDALSSLIYSRTGSDPISVAEALADIYKAAPVYKEFLSMGGDVYASRLAERIDRARKVEDLITPGKEGILVPFEKMGDYFRKYADTLGDISMAVPLAEYKRALAKYGNTPEGRIMAAMEARRVTYDPTRKGGWQAIREIGNFIPFWNVSLQDISMVASNLKRPETWAKGIAAVTLPTLILKSINEGNKDYDDLTPVDKAAFWHLYFGDKHIRIPIPWLLGTAFKVGAETFYDVVADLQGKGDKRAKEAWEGLYSNLTENLTGSLPPFATAYIEAATGKTPKSPLSALLGTESRVPDVMPRRLEGLPPKFQYTARTSQLARWFGDKWNVSPVKVDRLIKNFGGNLGADLLALTDEIAYQSGLAEDLRPEQNEANYLLLGHFVSNSPPSRTKYMNEFYEYLREAEQDKKAQKFIREKGLEESLDEISYRDVRLGKFQRKITDAFKRMRAIEDDDKLTPREKKAQLDEMQRKINDLYEAAVERVREAKRTSR